MFKADPDWIGKNSTGRKCTAFGHQIGTMSGLIDIAVMKDRCNSREEIICEIKKYPEILKRRKTDTDDDEALFQKRILGHLQWLSGGENSKGGLRDRLASLYGSSTTEYNEAYDYITKLAKVALQNVLGKSAVSVIEKRMFETKNIAGYTPNDTDREYALRQLGKPGEEIFISKVEDQIEKNYAARGIALSSNWRVSKS